MLFGMQGDVRDQGWASEAAELEQSITADSHSEFIALHSKRLVAKHGHPHPMLDDNAEEAEQAPWD